MNIEVQELRFRYNGDQVLKGLSFQVSRGDFLAIVGPNGAGKSTLLKCLDTILKPEYGTILVDGRRLEEIHRKQRSRLIGFVPQGEVNPYPSTVFETIMTGRRPYIEWDPSKEDLDVVAQVIADLKLDEIALRKTDEISGGQRQAAIFGRIVAQDPQVFLLDEPTANLDLKHQMGLLSKLEEFASSGKIVVIAIHDLNMALKYCNRFIMLRDGAIFASGGREIMNEHNIEQVYDVVVSIHRKDVQIFVIPDKPT